MSCAAGLVSGARHALALRLVLPPQAVLALKEFLFRH
jgi:hypothetical protein